MTNEGYAVQIARDWNTKDDTNGCVGYVTAFEVDADYLSQFPLEVVGGREHSEYWIPAERLEGFNSKIQGEIRVIRKFTAEGGKLRLIYRKWNSGAYPLRNSST